MDTEPLENELVDFAHARSPYDTHWMDDRIKVFLGRNIVIPRTEPADGGVTEDRDGGFVYAGSGPEEATASTSVNPNWIRNRARNFLAIADYLDHREAILAAKAAEELATRDKRRDELAAEFAGSPNAAYVNCTELSQKAIDYIIKLEGAAK